jgi:hypothetical protein
MCTGIFKYRTAIKTSLAVSLAREYRHVLNYAMFFGSIQYHTMVSICDHLLQRPLEWKATRKEFLDETHVSFFKETRRVLKQYRNMYVVILIYALVAVGMAFFQPFGGYSKDTDAWLPVLVSCGIHGLAPLWMNPTVTRMWW